jgi:hypothetical protein
MTLYTRCVLTVFMIYRLNVVLCSILVVSYTWKTEPKSLDCTCPYGLSI